MLPRWLPVSRGGVLFADGPSTLEPRWAPALGQNMRIAFAALERLQLPEDSILVSGAWIQEDRFTTCNPHPRTCGSWYKLKRWRDHSWYSNVRVSLLCLTPERVRYRLFVAEVKGGDIWRLVKVTPKGETQLTPWREATTCNLRWKHLMYANSSLRVQTNSVSGTMSMYKSYSRWRKKRHSDTRNRTDAA